MLADSIAPASAETVDDLDLILCPPALRGDASRALAIRMRLVADEMDNCRRQALELGLRVSAARLQRAREPWVDAMGQLKEEGAQAVADLYSAVVPGWSLNETGLATARTLVSQHGLAAVLEELRTSSGKYLRTLHGKATEESAEIIIGTWKRSLRWKRDRERDPVGTDLRYIRGIVRNQCRIGNDYATMRAILQSLEDAHAMGVAIEDLRRAATETRDLDDWDAAMADLRHRVTGGE